ncbi:unnamed protein product [Ranitomeya imitator]|uniref:Potassium channel domain-containing protein n=1 Tax=Ranitomeya imitator TaxID=111125 RepID=A0ABN9KSG8_9NEOB|nr:unnamed protein product [Ranitomeya imitator]
MAQLFWCSRQTMLAVALSLGYFMYLFMGAMMFQLLEKPAEANSRDKFQLAKLGFLQNFTCLDAGAIEQFVQIIMEAWDKGLNPKGNATNPSNWDFSNSFFFAGTVITTIVYGNLYPSTVAGQVFCVFYALFGIPLNVAFLNQIVKRLERPYHRPWAATWEGWSYGEGFYFAFITLSTIGFGDYVLGKYRNVPRAIHCDNYTKGQYRASPKIAQALILVICSQRWVRASSQRDALLFFSMIIIPERYACL